MFYTYQPKKSQPILIPISILPIPINTTTVVIVKNKYNMSVNKAILHYFNGRGRAEIIRSR